MPRRERDRETKRNLCFWQGMRGVGNRAITGCKTWTNREKTTNRSMTGGKACIMTIIFRCYQVVIVARRLRRPQFSLSMSFVARCSVQSGHRGKAVSSLNRAHHTCERGNPKLKTVQTYAAKSTICNEHLEISFHHSPNRPTKPNLRA